LERHLLEVRHIDIYYGDAQVIRDVSLYMDKGAIVALVGANGAGKSTVLRSISNIIPLSAGDIVFDWAFPMCLKGAVSFPV
jgi:branched-chain amino acid transport system ATP-binding protein